MISVISVVFCFITLMKFHQYFFENLINGGVLAAFGASSVLAFCNDELQQITSRNIFIGSLIGAVIGVFITKLELSFIYSVVLSMGLCVFVMNYYKIMYPPGGALVLIPLLSDSKKTEITYEFVLYPVLTGMVIIHVFLKFKKIIIKIIYKKWQVQKQ